MKGWTTCGVRAVIMGSYGKENGCKHERGAIHS